MLPFYKLYTAHVYYSILINSISNKTTNKNLIKKIIKRLISTVCGISGAISVRYDLKKNLKNRPPRRLVIFQLILIAFFHWNKFYFIIYCNLVLCTIFFFLFFELCGKVCSDYKMNPEYSGYRKFLRSFLENVDPNFQPAVRVPGCEVSSEEVIGQILAQTDQYLIDQ